MDEKTLIVKDVIQSNLAVSPEDGSNVFSILESSIKQKHLMHVDFSGLQTVTTAFLNAAIGDLYANQDRDTLNKFIKIDGQTLTNLQRQKVQLVMENARTRLSNDEIDEEM
ncbi:STAS-like domain-containing protein [Lacticaseibacillus songhuajiangensis]|uniref:STAS-like domain-containing protein n=1 Tax=Lacticaseibacillus songhuajiangensis TaxID=1296539 RepID=UPI0013DDFEC4|nr:STAS-like domain-containing protein [Lacticaseibacillus songhuajiangensis]